MVTSVEQGHSSFPSIDITRRSKRMQGQWGDDTPSITTTENIFADGNSVPQNPTIEGAIKFFKENAKGNVQGLYLTTSKYLEDYRRLKSILRHNEGVKKNEADTATTEEVASSEA